MKKVNYNEFINIGKKLLSSIEGEDPLRKGLLDTPKRFSKAFEFLTMGYSTNVTDIIGNALFDVIDSEYVLIKNMEFYSLCEHHLLPFWGKVHVAYVPDGKVVGLSKIPRLVNVFARRLQVQERLTSQVATELNNILKPKGVAVLIEANHMCMMMRGVENQCSTTVTRSYVGDFKENFNLQKEFLCSIGL